MEDINRIKMVLFEKKRTSRWLSQQLGVTPSTVSKLVYQHLSTRCSLSAEDSRFA